jgi:iron complex outermembrane recepter protein
MNRVYPALTLVTLSITPFAISQNASAQQTAGVEEETPVIIVTPQKREQYLQDVPIVVTPLSEGLLRDAGVSDIKELTILTPGLTVTSTQNETFTTARIRGVGTTGDNPGLESSVGIVIDGVYRPRNGVGFGDIGELQQIEVIKGPQGTLFGKNTSAGVVNISTKMPDFRFQAGAEVGAGNFGAQSVSGFVTGPLVGHTLAGRLYVSREENDGFNTVINGGGPNTLGQDADHKQTTVRGQLAFRPSSALFVRLIADYAKQDENCCGSVQLNRAATAPLIDALAVDSGVANPANPFARVTYLNRPMPQSIRDQGVSAEVSWDVPGLGGAALTSLTSWRNWQAVNALDADFSTADIWYRAPDGRFGNEFDQLTQELRLAGQSGKLNWLGGLFYTNEQLDSRAHVAYGTAFEPYYSLLFSQGASTGLVAGLSGLPQGTAYPLNAGNFDRYQQDSDSYALFTNNSYAITERLESTIGLRYTREEKTLDSIYQNLGGSANGCQALRSRQNLVNATFAAAPAGTATSFYNLGCGAFADPAFNNFTSSQQIDEDNVSGTAKLAYRFSAGLMSYLSYTRGYKASGFNLDRETIQDAVLGAADPNSAVDTDTSFAAETARSYELGFKTSWLNNSLLFDLALFEQRYNNFQLVLFRGNGFAATTVPQVKSRGADLDMFWFAFGRSLTLQAGVTYADTTYGNFGAVPGIPARLSGSQLSFAPLFSGTLAAAYERPLTNTLRWRASIAGKGTSRYNTGSDLNPAKMQSAYTLVNARLGIGSANDRWMVELWGQNITDEEYYQVIIDAPLQPGTYNGFLGDPRTYGVALRANF